MAQAFKKYKKSYLFFVISIITLVIGAGLFALGYGLSCGWDVVANWFTSKWAILLYILVGAYLVIVLIIFLNEKVKNYE